MIMRRLSCTIPRRRDKLRTATAPGSIAATAPASGLGFEVIIRNPDAHRGVISVDGVVGAVAAHDRMIAHSPCDSAGLPKARHPRSQHSWATGLDRTGRVSGHGAAY